jgi:hypothetical protein
LFPGPPRGDDHQERQPIQWNERLAGQRMTVERLHLQRHALALNRMQ